MIKLVRKLLGCTEYTVPEWSKGTHKGQQAGLLANIRWRELSVLSDLFEEIENLWTQFARPTKCGSAEWKTFSSCSPKNTTNSPVRRFMLVQSIYERSLPLSLSLNGCHRPDRGSYWKNFLARKVQKGEKPTSWAGGFVLYDDEF